MTIILILRSTQVKKIDKEIYEALEKKYGREHQVTVCIEELSELTKVLAKFLRNNATHPMAVIEEIADVEICLAQMKIFFDMRNGVNFFKDFKMKRLQKFYIEGDLK